LTWCHTGSAFDPRSQDCGFDPLSRQISIFCMCVRLRAFWTSRIRAWVTKVSEPLNINNNRLGIGSKEARFGRHPLKLMAKMHLQSTYIVFCHTLTLETHGRVGLGSFPRFQLKYKKRDETTKYPDSEPQVSPEPSSDCTWYVRAT
jgi:hypothetical protein